MRAEVREATVAELVEAAAELASGPQRAILGITGPPGAGKSTLGGQIVEALGPDRAVLVPMDGFHLADAVLAAHGLRDVKGAIHTFDAAGYAALVERIRHQRLGETVYAPHFDRTLEEPIAGSIEVRPEVPLVVTEGNYLLADDGAWPRVRACLTECWFLDPPPDVRRERLVARHVAFGKDPDAARAWALGTDEANAALIAATADRADRVFRLAEE
ncbi:nucleoside/nucleotide kinase family protein [Sinomonas susongensis]|uniref:nucleoside/nucleotide kinase family protein n=1 Tax=Sinomonas susongensis TaxID=1324851 RepID=UPI001107C761|nr:nucleoside/nucleotide kinase family protein [Sinomonas susongensis]